MRSDPYQQGQFRYLQETFANEIKHLEQYLKTLQVLDDFRFASRLERCPGEQQWSAKQHMPQAVVHARELPQNTPVTPSFGAPRAAPVPAKPSRASKAPNAAKIGSRRPAGNNVPAKVNSNRPTPEAKKTQKDTEPWESWEGQDKELASNLSNDIMDASPGVRWDDIAGLQDAKRILQACRRFVTHCMIAHYQRRTQPRAGSYGTPFTEAGAFCWHPKACEGSSAVWASRYRQNITCKGSGNGM